MIPTAASVEANLRIMAADALRQLEGIPAEDLNTWRPSSDLRDINTFAALATHLVGAGEYWVLHAAGGLPTSRERLAEFQATTTLDALRDRSDRWLDDCHTVLEGMTEQDLARRFIRQVDPAKGYDREVDWSVADCLVHAVEHTAVHVGHLQIQRQLWDAEHTG